MASSHNKDEKIIYVGDSRVPQKNHESVPRDYMAYPGKSEVFIPNFLLKEWMVASVFMVGFLVLILVDPAPLGEIADPTNAQFIPMPDWYFLFLYQMLKYPYLANKFVVFGTIVIPTIAFGALTLAPFLDTGKERRFYKRPISTGLMLLSIAAIIFLTNVSWMHYEEELEAKGLKPEKHATGGGKKKEEKMGVMAKDHPGFAVFKKATCVSCHGADMKGMSAAGIPALLGVGDKLDQAAIMNIIKNGSENKKMSAQYDSNINNGITPDEMNQLAEWLSKQKKTP